MQETQIIAVQFKDRKKENTFTGREYTYYSEDKRQVGDIIKVPTKRGPSTVKVSRTDILQEELDSNIDFVIIPCGYGDEETEASTNEMDADIINSWEYWRGKEPGITAEQLLSHVAEETGCDEDIITNTIYQNYKHKEE